MTASLNPPSWKEAKKDIGAVNKVIELIKIGSPGNKRGKRNMKYPITLSGLQKRASTRGEGIIENKLLNKECNIVRNGSVIKKGITFKNNAVGCGARRAGNVIVDLLGLDDKGSPVCGEVKITANNPWSAVVQCAGQVALLRSDRKFLKENITGIRPGIRASGTWGMVIAPSKYWKKREFSQAKVLMKSLREKTKVRICCVSYPETIGDGAVLLELMGGLPPYVGEKL